MVDLKQIGKLVFAITIAFSLSGVAKSAEAVPAFARQMGVSCNTCHYQYFPKLNSFGREFKFGGYTQTSQEVIEDDDFSIPPVLNLGFFMEFEYHQQDRVTANDPKEGPERGEWALPAEAVLFVGGRVGESLGALVEFDKGFANGKAVFSKGFGDIQAGLSLFSTESMGPGYGMEGWNTGVQMHIQPGINMMAASAISASMFDGGSASGAILFADTGTIFAAAGIWAPANGNDTFDTGFDLSKYVRLAVHGDMAGFDSMLGVVNVSGETKCFECSLGLNPAMNVTADANAGTEHKLKTELTAVDAQLQGDVGEMSLGVYIESVLDVGDDKENKFVMNGMKKNYKSSSLQVDLGVTHNFGLRFAYMTESFTAVMASGMNTGDKDNNATTIGFWYHIYQNVEIKLDNTTYGGDKVGMMSSANSGAKTMSGDGLNSETKLVLLMGF